MGRVRTKTVKRAAKVLLERHYHKLTGDFHINKKILSEVAKVPTKKLRNKIAGFATHLMKRIQKGPVKGISLKVQEEERERRLDWTPKQSEIQIDTVKIDAETDEMLRNNFKDIYASIEKVLDVQKTVDLKKQRKNLKNTKKGPRQGKPREKKEEEKKETPTEPAAEKEQKVAPKREARRRGNRDQ